MKLGLNYFKPVRSFRIDIYSNYPYMFECFSNLSTEILLLMLPAFLASSSALFEPRGPSIVSWWMFYNDCFLKQMYIWVAWSHYWIHVELEKRKVVGYVRINQLRLDSWVYEMWFVKGKKSIDCLWTSLKNILVNGLKIIIVSKEIMSF